MCQGVLIPVPQELPPFTLLERVTLWGLSEKHGESWIFSSGVWRGGGGCQREAP